MVFQNAKRTMLKPLTFINKEKNNDKKDIQIRS